MNAKYNNKLYDTIKKQDVGDDSSVCFLLISCLRKNQDKENEICSRMRCASAFVKI